jgi:hypothetical protein
MDQSGIGNPTLLAFTGKRVGIADLEFFPSRFVVPLSEQGLDSRLQAVFLGRSTLLYEGSELRQGVCHVHLSGFCGYAQKGRVAIG